MVVNKFIGIGLIAAGIAFAFALTDITEYRYQPRGFGNAIILIGFLIVLAGVIMLLL
jgi:hypothetical protein